MRLLTWNIMDGGGDEGDRLDKIAAWIRSREIDVAGLVELNGMDQSDRFEKFCEACGFEHGYVMSDGPSEYLLGVLSREPVRVKSEIPVGVAHGILQVTTGGLDVVCAHFAPEDANRRVMEAARCAALLAEMNGPGVLMGDLNAHSPADQALVEAFADPDTDAWAYDFRPHERILAAELIDLGAGEADRWTTATALRPDEPRRRIDFIYANAAFHERYPDLVARPIQDEQTRELSDHFPVIAESG